MTVPSYTEDLTDIATGDETAGWVELTGTDGSGNTYNDMGTPAYEDDEYPYIQGTFAVTQDCTKSAAAGSLAYSSGGITIPTDGAILVWHNFSSPFAMGTYAQGGYGIAIGSGLADFNVWHVGGSDKDNNPYGGFVNHAVNPTVTADETAGTPTGTLDYIGSTVYVLSGPSKGEPHQCDVIRYGRCASIFEYGETGNYCTITGFVTQNDLQANRWGLMQATSGGTLWKGLWQLGTTTNPVDFRDSNKTIFIQGTPKVTANFNTIEVVNSASNIEMTGFKFVCLDPTGTASKGRWITTDNATVTLNTCEFSDMYTFSFGSNTSLVSSSFNRCDQVTQNESSLDGCVFNASTSAVALVSDSLNDVGCVFISAGTGHAVNLGTISTTQSLPWNSTASGYAATDGSTGNETILVSVDTGITLTINVAAGASTPTVYNTGAGTVDVIEGQVNFSFSVEDENGTAMTGYEWRLYDDQAVSGEYGSELDGEEVATSSSQTYSYTYVSDDGYFLQVMKDNYVENKTKGLLVSTNQNLTIIMKTENN